MGIDFYYTPVSGPCKAVLLTAKALGLKLNCIHVNLMENEQLKPEYVKINPQHTVPTINDNGYHLWESRAIITYLVNKYGKDDSLYPNDPQQRGIVDQRLYFDMGKLYQTFAECYYPIFMGAATAPDPEKLKKLQEALSFLNTFLENSEYAAGKQLTVADFSLVGTVSVLDSVGFDMSSYNNVIRWYAKVQATAIGYEEIFDKDIVLAYLDKLKQKTK